MTSKTYDILVAGGGPAGLSAAYAASKAGARVAVFEKSKEIGFPIHTSGGSWIEELRQLAIPEKYMTPIREGIFASATAQALVVYDEAPSCILDVRGLYQYLAELASAEGAQILVDNTVTDLRYAGRRISGLQVRCRGRKQNYGAPMVIDASGVASLLARKAGLSRGFRRVGIGAEYDLFAPNWPADRVAFLFGSAVAPSGYGWIFPHGNRRIRVGVGMISPDTDRDPRACLDKMIRDNLFLADGLRDTSQLEYHTGIIPAEIYLQKTCSDGLLVVGDAGGLISTLLGEGIRYAIDIGRMAGEVAAEATRKKRYCQADLGQYERMWKKKYQKTLRLGALVNKRLSQYSDRDWDEKIRQLGRLRPDLVLRLLKGDFGIGTLMATAKSHPGFLGREVISSLKSLLKFA